MIQMQTLLDAADNSGARRLMCIKVLAGAPAVCRDWDVIRVTVKEAIPVARSRKLKVTTHCRSYPQGVRRADGSLIRFDRNAVVLLNNQHQPIGTRIFGPVTRELRSERFMRIISLAPEVL